jgi:amino acid transporter
MGLFSGWGLLVASVVFMVSATIPAATSTLTLIQEFFGITTNLKESTTWVTFTAAVWLTVVTVVVTKGIKHASYAQLILTLVETGIVLALVIGAFVQYSAHPAHAPSFSWLFDITPGTFATGALTAIFFYWGWDVTMNLGEETKDGEPHPAGYGAFWSMISLMLFYLILIIVVLLVLSDKEIADANTNVLYAIANKLFAPPWNYLAVLSTILSTIGTIETQILQFSRSMFAMARDNALHPRYSRIHPEWQTPWVATFAIWALAVTLLFASSYMPSVKDILDKSVAATCFQICFYMSMAGFACAWHYRGKLNASSLPEKVSYVLWPFLSAAFMVFVAVYSAMTSFDMLTNVIGIGGLLLGFVPLALCKQRGGIRPLAFGVRS